MGTSTVVILLAFLCAATAIYETSYQSYTKQELLDGLLNRDQQYKQARTINRGYPEDCNSTLAPPDDYSATYGDLLQSKRTRGDQLLLRETFLNERINYKESIVFWNGNFNGSVVTHVRSLNFGRERAWTKSIYVNYIYNYVEINVIIPANKTVRMFFEVYGVKNNRTAYELIN